MKTLVRNSVAAIALLAGVSLAAAQSTMLETSIQLSAAQKSAIYQSVSKQKIGAAPSGNLRVSVGAQLPASVELHALPSATVAEIPAVRSFKYTLVQNQVVLVDPDSRMVIEIIRQ